jgi:hypothetical protein
MCDKKMVRSMLSLTCADGHEEEQEGDDMSELHLAGGV